MKTVDMTDLMTFNNPDDEALPITQCVCGAKFSPWDFVISIYDDHPYRCPACNRAFFFKQIVKVYEVQE